MIKTLLPLLFIGIVTTSCWYRPNIMLKTPKNYEYATQPDTTVDYQYRIKPNDFLDFRLFTNDGFKLVDLTTLNENLNIATNFVVVNYLVEYDGNVKLPLLGRVQVAGKTIIELQTDLEARYAKYYIDPFVLARVINRRAIVFSGDAGRGTVIPLDNNNTTLMEGLALAGGIGQNGKARMVKLVRGYPDNPVIYKMDLSTYEGLKQADIVLEANDIVYVEPRISISREFTADFAPLVSLITSTIALIIVLNR